MKIKYFKAIRPKLILVQHNNLRTLADFKREFKTSSMKDLII
jgi:hypothetical protein